MKIKKGQEKDLQDPLVLKKHKQKSERLKKNNLKAQGTTMNLVIMTKKKHKYSF